LWSLYTKPTPVKEQVFLYLVYRLGETLAYLRGGTLPSADPVWQLAVAFHGCKGFDEILA